MSANLRTIKDQLTDKDYVLNVANNMLKEMLFEELPPIFSMTVYSGMILSRVEKDVNNIFKYANTCIQKMFYSSIFLMSLRKDIFFTTIMPPLHSATEQIEVVRESFILSVEVWRKFQRETGQMDMDNFLFYINNMSGWPENMVRAIQGGLQLRPTPLSRQK